ncbi:MAG: response regulator [Herbinix sp.]|nr:response regulator [Herbinix sp.]
MLKILVVDDSVFSQKITCNLMKGYLSDAEFFFANDGQEGYNKYKEIKPDYIFVDLLMPIIDGKELIKLIKEYDNTAKIIVISADVQKNVREDLEKCNIMTFINKPLNEEKANIIYDLIRDSKDE